MRPAVTILAAPIVAALIASAPVAQAEPYVLDKSHTYVSFTVSHFGFSDVMGRFSEFDAMIDFDPGNVEAARVDFRIDAASVESFWPARDRDLRGPNFLDTDNHPEIAFTTTSVTPTGTETADIAGDLTIRGVTRPVVLQARLNKLAPSPFRRTQTIAGFTVTGEIDRTEFGMDYAAPAIGAKVGIKLELEISPERSGG